MFRGTRLRVFVLIGLFLGLIILGGSSVLAETPGASTVCDGITATGGSCDDGGADIDNIIALAVDVLSAIAGIIGLVMLIIAGIKYTTSGGDAGQIKSAKNTLIYALVGLLVAGVAQFLAFFVLSKAGDTTGLDKTKAPASQTTDKTKVPAIDKTKVP